MFALAALALWLSSKADRERPPEVSAQDKTMRGSQSALDPHYLDNKRDLQLKMDVKWSLGLSPWIDIDHLHVIVRDGVVTLRGVVEDSSAVEAATRIASEGGAKKVINLLTIQK